VKKTDQRSLRDQRFVVMLDDEELERLRAQAGLIPLSKWVRSRLLGDRDSRAIVARARGNNPGKLARPGR